MLASSGLLDLGRGGGRLTAIVGSLEVVSGHFDLLLACSRLFEGLVDDIVSKAITRRNKERAAARFGNDEDSSGAGIPDHSTYPNFALVGRQNGLYAYRLSEADLGYLTVFSKVLVSFTRYFVDVLESSCTWNYAVQDDRRRLAMTVTNTFNRILLCAYGIDSIPKLDENGNSKNMDKMSRKATSPNRPTGEKKLNAKMMTGLLPAATHIADSFLSTSSGALRVQPILETFHDGLVNDTTSSYGSALELRTDQVIAALSFSTTLLRLGIFLERHHSQLESQLFKISPIVSRLYAVNTSYRNPVVSLFNALIMGAAYDSSEPPSLLGFLGIKTSKNFLQVLSDLDAPLRRELCTTSIWQFLGTVISNRQQWFANYILTGRSSKNMLKDKGVEKDLAALNRPLLDTALDSLSRINNLPKTDALAMLDFVALAQNFWPWATYENSKHAAFIKAISEYAGTMKPLQPSRKLDDLVDAARQTKIAASIAEILAMHLFHTKQMGNSIPAREILANLTYYTRFAVALPSYNSSVHGTFSSYSLMAIARTSHDRAVILKRASILTRTPFQTSC